MAHDELCIICGISPSGGPLWVLLKYALEQVTHDIVSEIVSTKDGKEYDEMVNIVREGLSSSFAPDERQTGYIPKWRPAGLADWFAFQRCVAIGHFDGEVGGAVLLHDEASGSVKIPTGREAEVRLVTLHSGGQWFDYKLNGLAEDEYGDVVEMEEELASRVTAYGYHPNFFASEGCYHYLQTWIDLEGMPPRTVAFPMESYPLTFGGEFYEIVNSRHGGRGNACPNPPRTTNANSDPQDQLKGTLNCIDYDGITATCVQAQNEFYLGRGGVKDIVRGIQDGLRGEELIPAILRDCRAWMFMRPDIWPVPSDFLESPQFTSYRLNQDSSVTPFDAFPTELLLEIHKGLPLPSCVSLWSTCKSLRALLNDSVFVGRMLKDAIFSGHLRWILPVETMPVERVRAGGYPYWKLPFKDVPTESDRANEAIQQWHKNPATASPLSRLLFPGFPLFHFVYACFQSDSMRNRERIWKNVKQFETLWRNYRTNGWEVDRFYDP